MLRGRLTQQILRALDWLAPATRSTGFRSTEDRSSDRLTDQRSDDQATGDKAAHLATGRRGEEDAYFYLRRLGYTFIALNYRSPHHRGEIDMVGWDGGVLCFVEVKTRTTRAVKPAEAAVDREKQRELRLVAREFVRHVQNRDMRNSGSLGAPVADSCQWRFDVVAVYYEHGIDKPEFELFRNAFPVTYNRDFARSN